jgi:hypothetical protein
MNRRALLTWGVGAASVLAAQQPILADLNPDRMWPVYRRYHLLIVGQRDDERSGALTAAVVEVLSRHLPASRPQLVSAADARRIGVLIATDQQDVAIMQAESAEALFLARPPFADIPEAPLRIIVSFGSHVLICRPNFMGPARLSAGEDACRTCGGPSCARCRAGRCRPGAPGIARLFHW